MGRRRVSERITLDSDTRPRHNPRMGASVNSHNYHIEEIDMLKARILKIFCVLVVLGGVAVAPLQAEELSPSLRESIDLAVAKVKPALVRIEVVFTSYSEGREVKYEASGSGVIISKEGYVVTNHHVAGHATRILCTLTDKEEVEAELVGRDPLTDLAVIKLTPEQPREFPVAVFGDSSKVEVGDHVLAMGSPLALSQSVTLGIVSNADMILPRWIDAYGGLTQDGENVGGLVKWIGHDAEIHGGNSGGPLVSIDGEIIGINEISIGLSGAIPGNLAKEVSQALITDGQVRRSWLGIETQPRLKHSDGDRGVLVAGTFVDSPAEKAGIKAGDILVRLAGHDIDVRFAEQLPEFNALVAALPIGETIEAVVLRGADEVTIPITTAEREEVRPQQHELKQWGATVRNISFVTAREMKRENQDGVLVTSVRPGGPCGEAKPAIQGGDVLVDVGGTAVKTSQDLRDVTDKLTEGATEPVPVLVTYERKTQRYLTVVKVGIKELEDPGREVSKAWLPVQTQVLTRDIAKALGRPDAKGFRVTFVFPESTAEKAGLQVGDYILSVDDMDLEASAPEDYEELPTLIRQYKIGVVANFKVLRGQEELTVPVELVHSPKLEREMKKYREDNFEFTVRDTTYMDKAREKWEQKQPGVLVERVESGGWAALGGLYTDDLILDVDGQLMPDVETFEAKMKAIGETKPQRVVFRVLRGIHTAFLEFEPKWETSE